MTMIAAMGRIEQIQSMMQQLAFGPRAATITAAAATATAATASADSFAASMAAAVGTAGGASAAGTSAIGATSGATGTNVVDAAKKYLGVPYVFGGEDASGMDCSGLVQKVYSDVGIAMPRLVSGQMQIGTEVASLAEALPGDLIVTGGGDHILIYAGDNKIIHAPYPGRDVCLRDVYMSDSEITTIRRIIPSITAGTTGAASATVPTTEMLSAAFAAIAKGGAA
ncbi:C40 family peptidase [Cryobacterium sp. Y50]|uniref:C40 family peptidase n=1 Tax=Cryobacterium sp. Y50 TaxID=2048286 RepID=UPI000CE35CD9|nr:C40 family peptidase [Cryobacterium sp. Y50]